MQGDVQVGIFSNDSFNHSFKYDGYPTNPIHIDMNTKIYVEVKGRKFFFLIEALSFFCPFSGRNLVKIVST